jgi:hypothetical protein
VVGTAFAFAWFFTVLLSTLGAAAFLLVFLLVFPSAREE